MTVEDALVFLAFKGSPTEQIYRLASSGSEDDAYHIKKYEEASSVLKERYYMVFEVTRNAKP